MTLDNQAIKFASKTDNLYIVESLVDEVCEEFKLEEDFYGNILIAVTEAVTNAIQHGNKYDPNKEVDLVFGVKGEKQISFTIKDQGTGFDPSTLPDPTDPVNIEKPHGRGIFLMKHLANDVEFDNEGRDVTLNFNLSAV